MSDLFVAKQDHKLSKATQPLNTSELITHSDLECNSQRLANSLFLQPDEISDLIGLQQSCAQKKWLTANGWIFQIDARGRPKIARSFFDKKMTQYPSEAIASLSVSKDYNVNTLALRRP